MEWKVSSGLTGYESAVTAMEQRVADIRAGDADELIWLVEHPPLYTAGTSAKEGDLLDAERFPIHQSGRGGQFTYHGPGQRVVYVLLDLKKRAGEGKVPDIRQFVQTLEGWLIDTLAEFGVTGTIEEGRVGVWVESAKGQDKVAALGVRVSRGVSYHGMALNVNPDLSHFAGIVPCGIQSAQYGVTSLHALEKEHSMEDVDVALHKHCPFG